MSSSNEMTDTKDGLLTEKVKKPGQVTTEESRGQWPNQIEFILSCLGYAVGLGNIWRFPYLCMRNGGGAFLVPYFLFLLVCGMPLFFLEVSIAQFSGLSPMQIWTICPLMKGLGYAMVILSTLVSVYYNTIICWTIYYLIKSFTKSLPWSRCGNSWNTPLCLVRDVLQEGTGSYNASTEYDTFIGSHQLPTLCSSSTNDTSCSWSKNTSQGVSFTANTTEGTVFGPTENQTIQWRSPAEEYWNYHVLEITDGVEDVGGIKWDLFGTFLLGWIIVFLCLFKGVKTSGKVVYVTATVPYLFITALLIRGVTLPGALDGIKYYIIPDWQRLLEVQVWAEAMLQIFYTLGPTWGGIITMASYNKFHNNCMRDGILIPLATCLTSFYGGFVIFSVLGFMAHKANLPIKDVVASGPGMAFIVYPEAVSNMPISPLWSVCFFCMLLSVGVDSMFATMETLISSVVDAYPSYLRRYKTLFIAGLCAALFLIGIPFVTRGGIYIFQLMDWYVAIPALLVAFLEFCTLAWVYGTNRLYYDIELMIGSRPSILWKISWIALSPGLLFCIIIYSFVGLKTPTYDGYEYPLWVLLIVWAANACPIIAILGCSVHSLLKQKGSFIQRLRASLKPHANWGPSDPECRAKYAYAVGDGITGQKVMTFPNAETKKKAAVELTLITANNI